MSDTTIDTAQPVVGIGRRGARYVDIQATQSEDFVVVITTRGQRYVVQAASVEYVGSTR